MLIKLKSFQTFELYLQTMQTLDKSIQHFYTFLHGALGENRGNFIIIQIIKHLLLKKNNKHRSTIVQKPTVCDGF